MTAPAAGLTWRPAQPNDLDQIGALLTARGDAADAEDHALVMADPNGGWESCAVVTDGARVVSTLTLLDEELRVAVPGTEAVLALPAGQVDRAARGRRPAGHSRRRSLLDEITRPPPPRDIRRYYVRLPAVPQLFDVLRPVFDSRLAAFDGDVPSFFGSHLRLPVNERRSAGLFPPERGRRRTQPAVPASRRTRCRSFCSARTASPACAVRTSVPDRTRT